MNNIEDDFKQERTEISNRRSKRVPHIYDAGSIWGNILYGIGTVIVIVGPLLIPGITYKDWIKGFFGVLVVVYIVICLVGAWKSIK